MDGVVVLGSILASQGEDDFRAAGVFGQEVGYVVDFAVEDDPAAVFCVMVRDLEVNVSKDVKVDAGKGIPSLPSAASRTLAMFAFAPSYATRSCLL